MAVCDLNPKLRSADELSTQSDLFPSITEALDVPREQAKQIYEQTFDENFVRWYGRWFSPSQRAALTQPSDPVQAIETFLQQYGFEVNEAENLVINLASKEINLDAEDITQVARAAAEPLSEMLSYSEYFFEIEKAVKNTKHFKDLVADYREKLPDSTRRNVHRLAAKDIFKDLLESGFSEELAQRMNIEPTLLEKIKQFVQQLVDTLRGADWDTINEQVSAIVENTFKGEDFIRVTEKEGYVKVDFQRAFDANPIAKDIMSKIGTNPGLTLTGSIAYSTQGTVYRREETVVHDLDFVNNDLSAEELDQLVTEQYPNAVKAYSFTDRYDVDTYLIPPPDHTIENLQRRENTPKIVSYDIVDADGEVAGTFRLDYNTNAQGGTIDEVENKTGVEAMFVDFFSKDETDRDVLEYEFETNTGETKPVNLSVFDAPFEAKLAYSRFKDIWDYNRFIPERRLSTEQFVSHTNFNREYLSMRNEMQALIGDLIQANQGIASATTTQLQASRTNKRNAIIDDIQALASRITQQFGQRADLSYLDDFTQAVKLPEANAEQGAWEQVKQISKKAKELTNALYPKTKLAETDFQKYKSRMRTPNALMHPSGEPVLVSPAASTPLQNMVDSIYIGDNPYGRGKLFTPARGDALQAGFIKVHNPVRPGRPSTGRIRNRLAELAGVSEFSEDVEQRLSELDTSDLKAATAELSDIIRQIEWDTHRSIWSHAEDIRNVWELFDYDGIVDGDTYVLFNSYDYWTAWNNPQAETMNPADEPPGHGATEPPTHREKVIEALKNNLKTEVVYNEELSEVARVRREGNKATVEVNPSLAQTDSLFHEFAHVFIDGVGGLSNPQVQRGVELLRGTELWDQVAGRYPDVSSDQLAREVLAEAMGRETDRLVLRNDTLTGQLRNWLELLMDRIRRVFGLPVNEVRRLSRIMLNGRFKKDFDVSRLSEDYQQQRRKDRNSRQKLGKKLKVYEDTINQINLRIQELSQRGDEVGRARFERAKYEVRKDLENAMSYSGMIHFINQADQDLNDMYVELANAMNAGTLTPEQLQRIYNAAEAYNTLPDIDRLLLRDPEMAKELGPEYSQLLTSLRHTLETIKDIYQEESFEFAVDFLKGDSEGRLWGARRKRAEIRRRYEREWREANEDNYPRRDKRYRRDMRRHVDRRMETDKVKIEAEIEDSIRDQLKTAQQDVGSFEMWLSAMKNMDHEILQIVAESVDAQEYRVIQHTEQLEQQVNRYLEPLREYKGNPADPEVLYEDILEKDEEGNLTGHLVSEYSSRFEAIERAFLRDTEVDRENDPTLWHYKKEAFYREHGQDNPAYFEWSQMREAIEGDLDAEGMAAWDAENPPPRKYIPSEKYKNEQFNKLNPLHEDYLGDDHPVVQFYKFFTSQQNKFDDMMPSERKRLGYRLPGVKKTIVERLSAGDFAGIKTNIRDQVQFAADDIHEGELKLEEDDKGQVVYVRRNAKGERVQHIPVHYRNRIDPKDQSYDLGTLLVLNGHMSMNYKYKNQILADLQMVQTHLANRRVGQYKGGRRQMMRDSPDQPYTIPGEQSKSYRVMEEFMNHRLYGRHTSDNDPFVDYTKPLGALMNYTGMLLLGGNVLAGTANVLFGESMFMAEARAGQYVDSKDFRKAHSFYMRHLGNGSIVGDIGQNEYNSVVNLLMKRYDSMNSYHPWSHKFSNKNVAMNMMQQHHIYFMNNVGEHMMHNVTMLALLHRARATNEQGDYINTDGKVVKERDQAAPLLEMYSSEDGELKLDPAVKRIEWDGEYYRPGEDFQFRMTQTIRQLNEFMHGAYAEQNANLLQRYSLGRMAIMMRKYMEPGIRRRFAGIKRTIQDRKSIQGMGYGSKGPRWDQQLNDFYEGNVTTLYRFWRSFRNSNEGWKHAITANWHRMTDAERANIHRLVTEAMIMIPTLVFAHVMYNIARDIDDEEEANRYWYMGYQANRLFSELAFYYPPFSLQEGYRVLKSPAATVSVIERSNRLFWQVFDPAEQYKSGRRKGDLKVWQYTKDMFPILKPVDQVQNMSDLVNIVYN